MNTAEEIQKIIKERYNDYKPEVFTSIGLVHKRIRIMVGDEQFLKFLKRVEQANPRPVYKMPEACATTSK